MLNISTYSSLMEKSLNAKSYNGSMLPNFTMAIATGIVNGAKVLTGTVTSPVGSGSSTGTGIIISGSNVSKNIQAAAIKAFGGQGPALKPFCDSMGDATQTEFAQASLSSDTNGPATFSNFLGSIDTMAAAIVSAAPNFTGSQWPNFAKAIATGICEEIGNNGTGTLSGASGPGSGSGVVTIS